MSLTLETIQAAAAADRIVFSLVVGQRHVQRLARLDFGHQQAFRERFGVRVLLDNAAATKP